MIELHIEVSGLITADYGKSCEAAKIHELFGTHRIPTPWTLDRVRDVEHFASNVITQIRARNPKEEVLWAADRCQEFVAFKFTNQCLREVRSL